MEVDQVGSGPYKTLAAMELDQRSHGGEVGSVMKRISCRMLGRLLL